MRLALVVSDPPSHASTGSGGHVARLADALAEIGHDVEAFAPRELCGLEPLAQRRERRGAWAVTWVNVGGAGERAGPPGEADLGRAFGSFLDRERPQVVHFEGLLPGLGVELVEEAKRRGLGTAYFAHDYELASGNAALLRPDLSPLPLGEREAEVRSELARRALARLAPRESAGGLARVEGLPGAARDALRRALEESLAGLDDLEEVRAAVKQSLERKRAAFAALDARFAGSRTLARRLSGALGRAVDWRPVGARAPAPRPEPPTGARRVRFAYVGEIDVPGGLHLLLDAFAGLEGAADLAVHGDGADPGYLRRCRERARELGVRWIGPVGPAGLEAALAEADVLVEPALGEGGPALAAHAARAAGIPVVAPRTEAMSELVRDDRDGLAFERGDADSLAAALRRLVSEEWLLGRLSGGDVEPFTIEAEAEDWALTYVELAELAERRAVKPRVAPPWRAFAERHGDLAARPDRELFEMVMQGLDALGAQMGVEAGPREFLAAAAGRGSRVRDGLAEGRRAIDWLTRSVVEHEDARRELDESVRVQEARIGELRQQIGRLGDAVRGREEELGRVAAERDELRGSKELAENARRELDAELAEARSALEALERERAFLAKTLEEGSEELRLLRERITGAPESSRDDSNLEDREALERHFESLRAELEGLRRHDDYLRGSMTELVESLGERLGADLKPPRKEPLSQDELRAAMGQGQERLATLVDELAWRRREMADARRAAHTLFARIAGGSLASRIRAWKESR